MAEMVLLAHAGSTLVMVGLIWFVQVVHYPLMSRVGRDLFPPYAETHSRLTSRVAGPPMLLEAATAVLLVPLRPEGVPLSYALLGTALLAGLWLSTAFLQVPRHTALGQGFDRSEHRRLVLTNWLRTALWSLRGLLVLAMLHAALG